MRDAVIFLLIAIPWLVVATGMIYAYLYWKLKKKDLDNQTSAALIEMTAKQLVQMRIESQNTLDDALMRSDQVNKLMEHNGIIFKQNKEVLKGIKADSVYLNDCAVFMYKHYKSLHELLEKVPVQDGVNMHQLTQVKEGAIHGLNKVIDFYYGKFKRHPEDAINEKQFIKGKRTDGSEYIGTASAN